VDFASQAQLERLSTRTIGDVPRTADPQTAVGLRLARAALDDLEMLTWTGALPDGCSWSRHAWWRVQLWQAFWRERDLQILRRARGARFWGEA
jgi:hypothetical protein